MIRSERMSAPTKNCLVCASKIPANALKCTECGTYQNWRRHLDFGNTFLALIIALLSVISLSSEKLSTLVSEIWNQKQQFEPLAQVVKIDEHLVTLLISNQGTRSFTTQGMLCQISRPGEDWLSIKPAAWPKLEQVKLRSVYFFDGDTLLWSPGSKNLVTFRLRERLDGRFGPQSASEQQSGCSIDFQGEFGADIPFWISLTPLDLVYFAVKDEPANNSANRR